MGIHRMQGVWIAESEDSILKNEGVFLESQRVSFQSIEKKLKV